MKKASKPADLTSVSDADDVYRCPSPEISTFSHCYSDSSDSEEDEERYVSIIWEDNSHHDIEINRKLSI